ncbi:carbohydrate ABC transporter permease, partial [Streptomyces sp. t39]
MLRRARGRCAGVRRGRGRGGSRAASRRGPTTPTRPGKKPHKRSAGSYAVTAAVAVFVLAFLSPFVIILLNSFKTSADYRTNGSLSLPTQWNWEIIGDVWERVDFSQKLLNSIQISLGVVLIAVLFALFNAYAIGIGRVRWRTAFLVFFLGANVLPQEGLVYPIYYLFKEMGLYDGKLGYTILVGITYSAFGTYLLSSVFSSFPRELIEAASMDGAGRWTILWRIVLPMSWPTLSVMCVFFFVWSWNEFLYPLVLLISNDNQTVPLGLSVMQGQYTSDPTAMSAAALLGIIPMVVFFLIFQRSLTRGLTAGAVHGGGFDEFAGEAAEDGGEQVGPEGAVRDADEDGVAEFAVVEAHLLEQVVDGVHQAFLWQDVGAEEEDEEGGA